MKEMDVEEDDFVKMYHLKRLAEMKNQAEKYVSSIRLVFTGTLNDWLTQVITAICKLL